MTIDNTASSVICFKNGYSYVNIPVELDDQSKREIKECNVGPLPSFAVHGTVGLEPDNPDDVKILSVAQAQKKDEDLKLPTGEDFSYAAFLQANIGSPVRVTLVGEERAGFSATTVIDGLVKWIQEGTDKKLAILQTQDKSKVLVDCSKIVQIETSKMNVGEEDNIKSLVVRFKGKKDSASEHKATLSYLTRGLTWAPSYTLLLNQTNKTMKLEGKACLLCDLPFFNGNVVRDIALVAGQPKMEFGNLSDPLASGEGAQSFIDQLNQSGSAHPPPAPRARAAKRNKDDMWMGGFGGSSNNEVARFGGSRGSMDEDLEEGVKGGETVQDFYHYKLENVPLKHDQPLSMDFIKQCHDLDYDDIYYLDLNKKISTTSRSNAKHDTDEDVVEAIHAISFKNVSGQPLTTAPVSVLIKKASEEGKDGGNVNENNFMVQGLMKFTPAEKSATVEITKAMDVDGKFLLETSKERKTELITEGSGGIGSFFTSGPKKKYADSIQKHAKVLVNNSKNEEIKCKIEYVLHGHLETSKPEPAEKTERQQSNSHGLNPITKYVWEIKVPAKKTAEITFNFCSKQWNTL